MRDNDAFIGQVEDYLVEFDGVIPLPGRVRDAIHAELPRIRQVKASPAFLSMPSRWTMIPYRAPWGVGAAAVVVVLALGAVFISRGYEAPGVPSADLGIFAPVAGRIVYGSERGIYKDEDGMWGIDPAASDPAATAVQLTTEPGIPMGWSRDGTRLLFQRGGENLFVLHADGTETQLTDRLMSTRGAAISPDGSRVVFVAGTGSTPGGPEGDCCARWALYSVDADGGPAEVLRESRVGICCPTFAPDGTSIAYIEGRGDVGHSVWLVGVDGSDAHQILANETLERAGFARGLEWSPAGDRIALGFEGDIYTFAPDGSDFERVITASGNSGLEPYWSPDGTRIAYTTNLERLAIVDADGSNAQTFSYGMAGPWHPGTPSSTTQPSPTATAAPTSAPAAVAGPAYCGSQTREVRARIPVGDGILGETGTILGCSRDGNRLLIKKGLAGNLFVLDTDGSETQVSEALSGSSDVTGSSRPTGATISPDGSRVVFAGKTERGRGCHDGALFAVDADGGPAELLWKSQRDGIVRDPMFSPDGTQIAFADGYCDSDQSVWVMNADGTDPHRIVGPIGAGHAKGLAWSPAGDRIALVLDAEIYTFAADGSGFTSAADATVFCWPGRRCY